MVTLTDKMLMLSSNLELLRRLIQEMKENPSELTRQAVEDQVEEVKKVLMDEVPS